MGRKGLMAPPHRVFTKIDMKGGDKDQCWIWPGKMGPNPVYYFNGKQTQVRRLVYSLKHGMHVDDVPFLAFSCGCPRCVNPYHAVPFAAIAGMIARNPGVSHAEAAKKALLLNYTKRGKKRLLTKRSRYGKYSGTKKRKDTGEQHPPIPQSRSENPT